MTGFRFTVSAAYFDRMIQNKDMVRLATLEEQARVLDPDGAERERATRRVLEHVKTYLEGLPEGPAYQRSPGLAGALLDTPLSDKGVGLEACLGLLERFVDHEGIATTSGRFTGYIPGGGLYHAALGDFMAAVSNRYAGVFFASPGAVRIENQLIRWMADLIGFGSGASGYLAAGGSLANLTAVVTARDAHGIEGEAVPRAVLYVTEHTHHCVDKALRIAGLGRVVMRRVAVDSGHRMSAQALDHAIRADKAAGLLPWMVLASAGTTNTGSVDPLRAVGLIAREHALWYHVDAAYGGFFLLTETGQKQLDGMELADSVVMDPHKTLFLPYGTGALIVRDGEKLRDAHASGADYMQDTLAARDEWSPTDVSPELTKHFRGLRMWLPLQVFGVAPFRAALEEKLLLARYAHACLGKSQRFESGPEPDLSVVTFRMHGSDDANKRLLEAVHADGRVFMSSTQLDGQFTLRLAIVSFRTHKADVDTTLNVLEELAADIPDDRT